MIAVDTNILVYAHREESPWHAKVEICLRNLAEGRGVWAIPWPCLLEFLAIVTHPRVYLPPTPLALALDQVDAWLEAPTVLLLTETEDFWPVLRSLLVAGKIGGPMMHDARVAALCLVHEVTELWTADRDFGRFPGLICRNVLLV